MSDERNEIERAIRETKTDEQPDGNISRAARRLGASRRTLQNRMRRYHMPRGKAGRPPGKLRRKRARGWLAGSAAALGAIVLVGWMRKAPTAPTNG